MRRILIVDDSATARRRLGQLFKGAGDFEVVGAVGTAADALRALEKTEPDVVSLDVYLGSESAAQLVRGILRRRKIPIVLVSDAKRTSGEVFEGLAAGAVDLVGKPPKGDEGAERAFVQLLRTLSRLKLTHLMGAGASAPPDDLKLVCVAASTGGPSAVREFLAALPTAFPLPIIVAQHLASGFETGLAEWLSQTSLMSVKVAIDGDVACPGTAHLIPPAHDGSVGGGGTIQVKRAPAMGYHPSADILFSSAATSIGGAAAAVILTGIGSDGLAGAKRVAKVGGIVLAQDRASSAVFGMPGAVTEAGIISAAGCPADLAAALVDIATNRRPRLRVRRGRE